MHINEIPPEDQDAEGQGNDASYQRAITDALSLDRQPTKPTKPGKPPAPSMLSFLLAAVSWLIIIGVVLFIMFGKQALTKPEETKKAGDAPLVSRLSFDWQAKFMTGYYQLAAGPDSKLPAKQKEEFREEFAKSLDALDQGALRQRLGVSALALEFAGPEAALKRLEDTQKLVDESESEQPEELLATLDALRRLYKDYRQEKWKAPSVAPSEMKRIKTELGFAGELAVSPARYVATVDKTKAKEPAKKPDKDREAVVAKALSFTGLIIVVASVICGWGALGLLILTLWVLAILISSGFPNVFRMKLEAGSLHGRVYAETFAIWLAGFVVTNILMSVVLGYLRKGAEEPLPREYGLLLQIVVFLGSLIVLVWPVIRGVSWRQVREDIGWTLKSPVTDTFVGPFVHSASMPIVACGLMLVLVAASISAQFMAGGAGDPLEPVVGPSHPIAGWLAEAGAVEIAQIFFLACVCAPIVEETMFRGVLYKHLRDETSRWSAFFSIAFSTLLNSFIFAAIHPQGIIAIPLLMSLAIGFTLAREWRSSLIAPMIAHGVNNAGAMTLMLLLFRN